MFTTIFSVINDVNDLKKVANTIREQLINAYNDRAAQLSGTVTAPVNAPVTTTPALTKTTAKTEVKKETPAKAKKEKKETATKVGEDVQIAITDKNAIAKLNLTFVKYSDKSWSLYGDTKPLSKALEKLQGSYNPSLGGEKYPHINNGEKFKGWVFRTKDAQGVADALGIKVKVAS